jgi:dihydropyrimidinase
VSTVRLLIRGGEVVTAEERFHADVRIEGEKIVEIARRGLSRLDGETEINADGLQILPGGIDPHVHLTQSHLGPPRRADNFTSGSEAALAGGITTIGNMAFPASGDTLSTLLEREERLAAEQAIVDVMLHPVLPSPTKAILGELSHIADEGYSAVKWFMSRPDFEPNSARYLEAAVRARELGLLTMIHCEDHACLAASISALMAGGKHSLAHFAESRPVLAEAIATERAIGMCEASGAPIYIVHLSSQQALDACRRGRARGLPVFVETRPPYLYLTAEKYHSPTGPLHVMQPPLREQRDVEALWKGITDGAVDTVGSDHAPWTREQKLDPALTVLNHLAGISELETMLPMLYSEGVRAGRISVEQFVSFTSTKAAHLFGLYPAKGTVAPGSDADLALWNPRAERTISGAQMKSRAGHSVYEGWRVMGWPTIVLRRGEVVHRHGQTIGRPGTGRRPRRQPITPVSNGH